MPFPIILVSSTLPGSDSAASGAGPSTAITGSTGRTRNTASQLQFGLFGATDSLTNVLTDGSHVIYMDVSTAGQRNFSSISAKKDTRHTDIGSITSGVAILSAIASTSGWTVGDVIKVTGAGAASADLYSTILTVDSATQVTLNDTAGTTVAGAVVENPKQVTLTASESVNTGATNTVWAIGGVRATIGATSSRKLAENNGGIGDAMPGWTIEMKSGHAESISTAIAFRRGGDITIGKIELRGEYGALVIPKLTATSNIETIKPNASIQMFSDFEIVASSATVTGGVICYGSYITITRIRLSRTATNVFNTGFSLGQNSKITECHADRCGTGIRISNYSASNNNYITNCTTTGINIAAYGAIAIGNIIHACQIGITHGASGSNEIEAIIHNTISSSVGDGIYVSIIGDGGSLNNLIIQNNIMANNGGYGLNFNNTSDLGLATRSTIITGNTTYNNTSNAYKSTTAGYSYNNCPWATGDTGLNPQFTSAAGGDFSIGTVLKAQGYPLGGTKYVGSTSTTYSYVDPGAAQRQEAGGPSGPRNMTGGMQ